MIVDKKVLFVITDGFVKTSPKISKRYLKNEKVFLFYRNCENAIDMVRHNMPGGNYVVFIFDKPLGFEKLAAITKRVNKKNKIYIYTNELPLELKNIDGCIRKIDIDDDLPYLMSLI